MKALKLAVLKLLPVHPADFQIGDLVESTKVVSERLLDATLGNVVLDQVGLKVPEKLAAIIAPFRFQPILRIEKHFPVGLPDSVVLHPIPAILIDGARRNTLL